KVASPDTDVQVDEPITFSLTVRNGAGRPTAYDAVVADTVPAGLIVDVGAIARNGAPVAAPDVVAAPGVETGAGGQITWTVGAVAGGDTELSYTATIDPTTGGGASYTNGATVTAHTLPADIGGADTTARRGDRRADDEATV